MDPWMTGFGAFILVMGGWALHHHRSSNLLLEASRRWSTARGEIVSSEVKRKPGSIPTWEGRANGARTLDDHLRWRMRLWEPAQPWRGSSCDERMAALGEWVEGLGIAGR